MVHVYAIYTQCPACGKETKHRILRGHVSKSGNMFHGTVQCVKCGHVQKIDLEMGATKSVPVIVSWLGESEKFTTDIGKNDVINVGDEFYVGSVPVIVTGIELEGQKRVKKALGKDIKALWAKRYDRVRVKFSISQGPRTISKSLLAVPDEEFAVGDMLDLENIPVIIYKIKAVNGHKTRALAKEIVRIYAKRVKNL